MSQWKMFPIKLPKDYHGKPRPLRKLSEISREKCSDRQNPEFIQSKIGHWQIRRLDRDVNSQRKQFIVHPAKISEDTPNWFKTTYQYFQRSNYNDRNKDKIDVNNSSFFGRTQRTQDAFNRNRNRNSHSLSESKREWREPPVAQKIGGSRDHSLTNKRWFPMRQQVTGKVGSIQGRDFSIRRPQLKIGTKQSQNYIDTYSVA